MKFKLIIQKNLYIKFLNMTTAMKYFIGNWKMFGIPSSSKFWIKLTNIYRKDKKNKKNIKL